MSVVNLVRLCKRIKEEGMKLALFIGFADTVMQNALSIPLRNEVIRTAGLFICQTVHKLQDWLNG